MSQRLANRTEDADEEESEAESVNSTSEDEDTTASSGDSSPSSSASEGEDVDEESDGIADLSARKECLTEMSPAHRVLRSARPTSKRKDTPHSQCRDEPTERKDDMKSSTSVGTPKAASHGIRHHPHRFEGEAEASSVQRRLHKLLSLRTVGVPATLPSATSAAHRISGGALQSLPPTVGNADERFLYALMGNPQCFYHLVDDLLPSVATGAFWEAAVASEDVSELIAALFSGAVPGFREAFQRSGKQPTPNASGTGESLPLPTVDGVTHDDALRCHPQWEVLVHDFPVAASSDEGLLRFFTKRRQAPSAVGRAGKNQPVAPPKRAVKGEAAPTLGGKSEVSSKPSQHGSLLSKTIASWGQHMEGVAQASGVSVVQLREQTRQQQSFTDNESLLARADTFEMEEHKRLLAASEAQERRAERRKRDRDP